MCDMHYCDNDIDHPKLGLCNSCYGIMLRWRQRNSKHAQERALKLKRWMECMDMIMPASVNYKPYVAVPNTIQVLPGDYRPKKYKVKNGKRQTSKKRRAA